MLQADYKRHWWDCDGSKGVKSVFPKLVHMPKAYANWRQDTSAPCSTAAKLSFCHVWWELSCHQTQQGYLFTTHPAVMVQIEARVAKKEIEEGVVGFFFWAPSSTCAYACAIVLVSHRMWMLPDKTLPHHAALQLSYLFAMYGESSAVTKHSRGICSQPALSPATTRLAQWWPWWGWVRRRSAAAEPAA